jgi:hypothetical protein
VRVRPLRRLEDRLLVVDPLAPPEPDVLARGQEVAGEVLEDDRDAPAELVGS